MSHDLWSVVPQAEPGLEPHLVNYVRTLEALFIELRGRGVQWSPEDGQLAAGWYRSGIELPRVEKALAERRKAWQFRHGDRALPRSLSFYRRAVERELKIDARHLSGVAPMAEFEEEDPYDQLDALVVEGKQLAQGHQDRAVSVATDKACAALKRLRDKTELHGDLDDLLGRVDKIRARMSRAIIAGVGPAVIEELMRYVNVSPVINKKLRQQLVEHQLITALDARMTVSLPWWGGWSRPLQGIRHDT